METTDRHLTFKRSRIEEYDEIRRELRRDRIGVSIGKKSREEKRKQKIEEN